MTDAASETSLAVLGRTLSAPFVTVVLPSYNARACIMRALDSVRVQTFEDFEIVVIDDASTDGTVALVKQASRDEPRLRLIRLDRNSGPAHARNAGLTVAHGEWIALLDADDAWRPDRLARLLEQSADSDAVFDNLAGYDPAVPAETGVVFPEFPNGTLTIEALLSPQAPGSRHDFGYLKPLIRRAFLNAHGLRYDESLRTSEDLLLYTSMLLAGARTRTIDAPLYLYSVPGNAAGAGVHSHTVPRDDDVGAALERLWGQFEGRLSAGAAHALDQRIAFLRRIRPIADFYHARRRGDYRRLTALLFRERAVRREVMGKVWQWLRRKNTALRT